MNVEREGAAPAQPPADPLRHLADLLDRRNAEGSLARRALAQRVQAQQAREDMADVIARLRITVPVPVTTHVLVRHLDVDLPIDAAEADRMLDRQAGCSEGWAAVIDTWRQAPRHRRAFLMRTQEAAAVTTAVCAALRKTGVAVYDQADDTLEHGEAATPGALFMSAGQIIRVGAGRAVPVSASAIDIEFMVPGEPKTPGVVIHVADGEDVRHHLARLGRSITRSAFQAGSYSPVVSTLEAIRVD